MSKLRLSPDLTLPPAVVTEKLAFLGRTGSGKTYAAQKLAEQMHAAEAQFVVLDPVGVWYGLRLDADGKSPGLPIPVLGGLRGDIPLEPTGGALIADLVVDRGVSMILDVSQFESDADKARFAQAFADRFYFRKKAAPSAIHLFIEECQEFVPQNPQRDDARMLHAFTRLVKIGRNFGIGVSLISQRPQEVNKKVLNLTELLFCFQLTGPQERKTIEGWIADKGLDEDIAGELPKLKVGQPHVWSPAWLAISKVIQIERKATADVSSTPKVGTKAAARELAPIDLERLRTEMAATIEKAKAEDPRALRAEIARLKGELGKKPAPAGKTKVIGKAEDRAALREQAGIIRSLKKALEAAMKFIVRVSAANFDVPGVEKAELEKAISAAVERAAQIIDSRLMARERAIEHLREQAAEMIKALKTVAETPDVELSVEVTKNEPFSVAHPSRVATPKRTTRPATGPGQDLPKGERAVLTAAAQHDNGVTREQLTVLTGYKRSSRDTYVQRLRERGHLEARGEQLLATQAGVDALGSAFIPLPTGDALREHWLGKLPEGERRVFELVTTAHPRVISRDEISDHTGYKRSSRDTYLQRLGARRLVTTDRDGVRASEELFG